MGIQFMRIVHAVFMRFCGWSTAGRRRAAIFLARMLLAGVLIAQCAGLAAAAVYCVDSARGRDTNAGTEASPWQTVKRANQAMGLLKPGDAVCFRRGGTWPAEVLKVHCTGNAQAPITFGAYGSPGEARPSLNVLEIKDSEHIMVRDLELSHSRGGACLSAMHSGYLTVMGNVVHDCASNGIVYGALTHHTATLDNVIYNVAKNDGVSIHDTNWGPHPEPVGSHHWVVDNIIYDMDSEDCIDAATNDAIGSPAAKAGEDIKIIGNRCARAKGAGIVVGHEARRVWAIGNTILDCARTTANPFSLGNPASGGTVQASGNLLIDNMRRMALHARGRVEHNTIISRNAIRVPVLIGPHAAGLSFERNLVVTTFREWVELDPGLNPERIKSDWNWYCSLSGNPGDGTLRCGSVHTLAAWRAGFKLDASSVAGAVAGLRLSPPGDADPNLSAWDNAFFARCVPGAEWPGFTMGGDCAGAFGPDGKRLGLALLPFDDYEENDGYGWAGPPMIQRRYPILRIHKKGK